MDKIIGMGNALTDVLATLDNDCHLDNMGLAKGSMTLINQDKLRRIEERFHQMETTLALGGSAGNTLRALAHLGLDTAFIGKVGKDHYGDFYRQSLLELGARPHLFVHPTLPSGVAATFISPDGERTFGTYLGAAATQHADELSASLFKGFTCFYIEGYMVQDHDLIVRALSLAKESGLQICIDLASYNIVLQERDFFEQLIDQYVDIVFANEEEARAFSGREDPVEALHAIAPLCSIAVVKARKRGSYIRKGTNLVHVGAPPVANVVDTTAAGDYFAAGFLYGLASGFSLEKCGKTGSLLAGEIIQLIGAELSAGRWESIKTNIHSL